MIFDNQQRAAQLVRSWRDHLILEAGPIIPPLIVVGGKVLRMEDIFTNIATAIELLPRRESTLAGPSPEEQP